MKNCAQNFREGVFAMNENKDTNREVFTKEELARLNEELKENENIELPDALKKENIEKLISETPQIDEAEAPETDDGKSKKKRDKKLAIKILAFAAAFVIAFTSVMTVKPWKTAGALIKKHDKPIKAAPVENYAEIEKLFAGYAASYEKAYTAQMNVFSRTWGFMKSSAPMDDFAVNEASAEAASPAAPGAAATGAAQADNARNEASGTTADTSYGKTNEQVEGVHEADIIKNDGRYIYAFMPTNETCYYYYNADETEQISPEESKQRYLAPTCAIAILEKQADGTLKTAGMINIAPEDTSKLYAMHLTEMYVSGNRLVAIATATAVLDKAEKTEGTETAEKVTDGNPAAVPEPAPDIAFDGVYTYAYPYMYNRNTKTVTVAVSFDITDRSNPKEEWRIFQDGYYVSSRNIGDNLVLITDYGVPLYLGADTVVTNCVPKCGVGAENYKRIGSDDICVMQQVNDSAYLVASTLNVTDAENTLKTEAVLGGGENVYCTQDTLYVTSQKYTYSENIAKEIFGDACTDIVTQIYKFDIAGGNIKYLASASVAGYALDQFSIDEKDGFLRIATSTGYWGEDVINIVHILDGALKPVGTLGNIAKGEVIKAVRFTGNTAYVVTFEQTDPLFVIDLSDPAAPKITGELKLPGYSQYLHPITDTLLLGVGVDGDENGAGNGLKISLFDVSDPKAPVEADRFVAEGYEHYNENSGEYLNITSAAQYDHKAFCFDEKEMTVYIPYERYENSWSNFGSYNPNNKDIYGAYAFKIDTQSKKINAPTDYVCETLTNNYLPSVNKVTFIGGTVICYSSGANRLYTFDKTSAKFISSLSLNADDAGEYTPKK